MEQINFPELYHEKLSEKDLLGLVPREGPQGPQRQNILKLCMLQIFEKCNFQDKTKGYKLCNL